MSTRNLLDHTDGSDDAPDDPTFLPQTYIVIRISPDIKPETLKWLIERIKGEKWKGGAELVAMKQPLKPDQVYNFIFM